MGTRTNARTATLALALMVAMLAVFAAQARAGSYDSEPPKAVLMKYETVLQVGSSRGAGWNFYQEDGGGRATSRTTSAATPTPTPTRLRRAGGCT